MSVGVDGAMTAGACSKIKLKQDLLRKIIHSSLPNSSNAYYVLIRLRYGNADNQFLFGTTTPINS